MTTIFKKTKDNFFNSYNLPWLGRSVEVSYFQINPVLNTWGISVNGTDDYGFIKKFKSSKDAKDFYERKILSQDYINIDYLLSLNFELR